ncbi:hypothetical protein S40288_10782 [Stachybotrys chartarum IBT 40288]|nr:hypothetical protein S40288_10782 [Stachybotrys chartarum IBT 40288]
MTDTERPPKRLRRDTRRCYECRRRKVKCQRASEAVDTCSECVRTGATCSLDPPLESTAQSQSLDQGAAVSTSPDQDARFRRIEDLLQQILQLQQLTSANSCPPPIDFTLAQNGSDAFTFDFSASTAVVTTSPCALVPAAFDSASSSTTQRTDPVRERLLSLLPSQEDAFIVCSSTKAWILELPEPPAQVWCPGQRTSFVNVASDAHSTLIRISKLLLYLSLCMQQLPTDFDASQLGIGSPEDAVQTFIHTVTSSVLFNDDLVSSEEGMECFSLLGMIYINNFDLKRAWLVFRRALDVGRLLGLDENFASSASNDSQEQSHSHRLWLSAVMGDCYCSLLLGMKTSWTPLPLNRRSSTFNLDDDDLSIQLCLIASNWSRTELVDDRHFETACKAANEALDELQDTMPSSWWQTPSLGHEQSLDAARDYERLVRQAWFFQIRILVNLFAVGSNQLSQESAFKEHALEAARITLHRYQSVRLADNSQLHCRVLDIAAYVAIVTIVLVKLSTNKAPGFGRPDSDTLLSEQALKSLEQLSAASPREQVARQSVEIVAELWRAGTEQAAPDVTLGSASTNPRFDTLFGGEPSSDKLNGAAELLSAVFRKAIVSSERLTQVVDQTLLFVNKPRQGKCPIELEEDLIDTLFNSQAFN